MAARFSLFLLFVALRVCNLGYVSGKESPPAKLLIALSGTTPLKRSFSNPLRASSEHAARRDPNVLSGLLSIRQYCTSGYGLCSNGRCCLLGGDCCTKGNVVGV